MRRAYEENAALTHFGGHAAARFVALAADLASLRRPFRRPTRIGDDEQDVLDHLVSEKAPGHLVGRQCQFPLADRRAVARNWQPVAAIGSARTDHAVDRVGESTDRSLPVLFVEQEPSAP